MGKFSGARLRRKIGYGVWRTVGGTYMSLIFTSKMGLIQNYYSLRLSSHLLQIGRAILERAAALWWTLHIELRPIFFSFRVKLCQ